MQCWVLLVIVEEGELAARVAEEGVGPSWVVQVMDGSSDQHGSYLKGGHGHLQQRLQGGKESCLAK